ncbi:MAG: alpha/beta hydrolase [Alphaproteobacteria bacterium]|nr:alpha/beta hydrolase [Alphaproteobacteria bacterium]
MIIDMKEGPVLANTGGAAFDPKKPVAILVHGAGCDHSIWGGQNRYIAHHGASVLSLDLPGHGRSPGPAIDSIGGLADFVIRVVDSLEIERPILIGHSMGGLTVLEAASRLGDRCAGLGLCGVAAKMPVHPALLDAARNDKLTAAELIAGWGHGSRAHRGGNPSHGIWMLRQAVILIDRMAPGVLHADLAACNDYQGALEAAAKVSCPTQLLLGRGDKMTPVKVAQPLIDAIDGAEATILDAAGHMMTVEAPRESCMALMSLIRKVAG